MTTDRDREAAYLAIMEGSHTDLVGMLETVRQTVATARAEGYRDGIEAAARKCRSVAESSAILATVAAKAGQSHVWSGHEARSYAAEGLEIAIRALAPVPDSQQEGMTLEQVNEGLRDAANLIGESLAKATDPRGSDAEIIAAAREWAQFGPHVDQLRAYLAQPGSRKANKASVRLLLAVDALPPTEPPR